MLSDDSDKIEKLTDQLKNKMVSKIADMYDNARARVGKFDPEQRHWEMLKNWRNNNVKYNCLRDIERYKFKSEDEEGFYK